jgi:methionyl-tRNA formyltransferase
MRILYLGNNLLGVKVLAWLKAREENIVGMVVHPPEKAKYRQELIDLVQGGPVWDGSTLRQAETLEAVARLQPDLGVSVLFGYIVQPALINLFPQGIINLHPSYLPYNRGAYPNVWSIIEGTPAGVTLHYIDAGVDTGDIIAQRQVEVAPTDTGQTLYYKLEQTSFELFTECWPQIRAGTPPRIGQPVGEGTVHRVKDVAAVDEIDLGREYKARELIDLIRARTFPPHTGAYFKTAGGRKVYVRLELFYADEEQHDQHD